MRTNFIYCTVKCIFPTQWISLDSFSFKNIVVSSWSKFLLKGTGLCYQLDSFFSDQSYWILDETLIKRCSIVASWQSKYLPVKKNKKWKKRALEVVPVPDQTTRLRSKTFMIRPNCARSRLWSDPSALESAYDQTFQTKLTSDQTISRPWSRLFRPKLFLIRSSPDHWPDCSAVELPSKPCNFGLWTHGCALDWVWS